MAPKQSKSSDIAESVRRIIAALIPNGPPDIQRVARMLGKNPRTLQRRLAELGTTYSRVLREVRRANAIRLIEDSEHTFAEISVILGYADPAHFTRAFEEWTGMCPRDYRAERRASPVPKRNDMRTIKR